MADEPASTSSVFRSTLFWLAWLLLAISLLIPAPAGSIGSGIPGGSALHVYDMAAAWNVATPGSPGGLRIWQEALLALALYSNVAFIIMPYMLRVANVSSTCK